MGPVEGFKRPSSWAMCWVELGLAVCNRNPEILLVA